MEQLAKTVAEFTEMYDLPGTSKGNNILIKIRIGKIVK